MLGFGADAGYDASTRPLAQCDGPQTIEWERALAAGGSTRVVIFALTANFSIAVAKFSAYLWTGSSAMLSEAIHSLVDTSNQALLLYGQKRSERPADARHPFGYARELFFWSFIVAILLFSLGAGVAIYEGVEKLLHPHPVKDAHVNYIVLAIAIVLESASTWAAVAEFNARRGTTPVMEALRTSKDPALFTILAEDIAALIGLFIALAGILAADIGGIPEGDGIASIAIGIVLATVAAFIAIEVKALLIGEAASDDLQAGVRQIVESEVAAHRQIKAVNDIRTMQLGAHDVLVAASLDFDDATLARDIEAATDRMERQIRSAFPDVRKLYIEVQSSDGWQAANGASPSAATVKAPVLAGSGQAAKAATTAPASAKAHATQPARPTLESRPKGRNGRGGKRR